MSKYEDEDFIALSSFIKELAQVDYYLEEQFEDKTIAAHVKSVEIESPCQMDVAVDESGNVSIGTIPPMYYVSTSFMPVFHNIKLTIDTELDGNNE